MILRFYLYALAVVVLLTGCTPDEQPARLPSPPATEDALGGATGGDDQ